MHPWICVLSAAQDEFEAPELAAAESASPKLKKRSRKMKAKAVADAPTDPKCDNQLPTLVNQEELPIPIDHTEVDAVEADEHPEVTSSRQPVRERWSMDRLIRAREIALAYADIDMIEKAEAKRQRKKSKKT